MSDSTAQNSNTDTTGLNRDGVRGITKECLRPCGLLGVLLLTSGKIDWINAWVFFGLFLFFQILYVLMLIKINPQLLNYRSKIQKGTKRFDKVFFALYLPAGLATMVIAGLDAVRYAWSTMSLGFILLGVAIYIPAFILVLWAMAVNTHFEATVRIQTERNHQVCTSGPYKIVRHPGYIGIILGILSMPLILGSWWGFVPASIMALLFVIRTALEDRTLQRELPGYKEYTNTTRYRLLPLVW